jgi:HSP20 family protein
MTMLTSWVAADPFVADLGPIDDLLDPNFGCARRACRWLPPLDVRRHVDKYVLLLDLPGMRREDISIDVDGHVLTISGRRSSSNGRDAVIERLERPSGPFVRRLNLPQTVDPERIVAEYADGVLTVHVPKQAGKQPTTIPIDSE